MDRCYFAKECPKIEIRNGLVFIQPEGSHCEIALSPATLRNFIVVANECLAKWQVDQLDKVKPIIAH